MQFIRHENQGACKSQPLRVADMTRLDMTRTFAARVFLDRLGSWDDGDATSIHVSCSRVQFFCLLPNLSPSQLGDKHLIYWKRS